jgi:hypothetical protein
LFYDRQVGSPKAVCCVVAAAFFIAAGARGQTGSVTLSGHVTGPSQAAVAHATLVVRSVTTGQSLQTETDPTGAFSLNLTPGSYELSVSAAGFRTRSDTIVLNPGFGRTLDVTLVPESAPLSLEDLGIPAAEASGNPEMQATLDKRSHMLQIHQRMGLITTAPMLATVITSFGAKSGRLRAASPTGRDLHTALGAATAAMYFTTAYFAIRAPKIPETEVHGRIRLHRALAWVHGPGMVLTPVLGAMAFSQASSGQRVHGIASMHSQVAIVTLGAYAGAILSVSLK